MGKICTTEKMLVICLVFLTFRFGITEAREPRTSLDSDYVWKPYPREMYPHFKRAYKELASSDSKIAIFFHALNLNVTKGVYNTEEPDYTFTTDGHADFYYNWNAHPTFPPFDESMNDQAAEESNYAPVTDQAADESIYAAVEDQASEELTYATVTDQPSDESMYATVTDQPSDESMYATVTDQPSDESIYAAVTNQDADESLYTTVPDQVTDESMYATVEDQNADESLYATVIDQDADGSLYAAVTDQATDESLYTAMTDQATDGSVFAAVTDQDADGSMYTAVTDEDADGSMYATVTDEDADGSMYATITEDTDGSMYAAVTDQDADGSMYAAVTDEEADGSMYATITDEADGSLYTTVTDQDVDGSMYVTGTDQDAVESLYSTLADQTEIISPQIQHRLGMLIEELQSDQISSTETVGRSQRTLCDTVKKSPKPPCQNVEEVDSSDENVPLQVGSIRGIPGVHFPDYYDIPITTFTCADKKYIPGFYADLETGCQVFHVCWPHRRESFLCPVGTTFNQAILACDYWYSTNCSVAPLFFDVNARVPKPEKSTTHTATMIRDLVEETATSPAQDPAPSTVKPFVDASEQPETTSLEEINWSQILKFLPVKSKIVIYPEASKSKLVIKHALKPDRKQKSKVDAKVKLTGQIMDGILNAIDQTSIAVESVAESVSPKKKQQIVQVKKMKPAVKQNLLPKINKKFVVEPLKMSEEKPLKLSEVKPTSGMRKTSTPVLKASVLKPKASLKVKNENIPEIVMRALEMAGSVLQRDILPFTRKVLIDSSANVHKVKKM